MEAVGYVHVPPLGTPDLDVAYCYFMKGMTQEKAKVRGNHLSRPFHGRHNPAVLLDRLTRYPRRPLTSLTGLVRLRLGEISTHIESNRRHLRNGWQ